MKKKREVFRLAIDACWASIEEAADGCVPVEQLPQVRAELRAAIRYLKAGEGVRDIESLLKNCQLMEFWPLFRAILSARRIAARRIKCK
jgi:hypothetical protein